MRILTIKELDKVSGGCDKGSGGKGSGGKGSGGK